MLKKFTFSLFILIISLVLIVPPAYAGTVMRSGERIELDENEIVDGDYFAAGETLNLSGTVNGDAYVAGNKIIFDGTVNGDLLVAGRNLDIRGTVTGDIRAAGEIISISGSVGGNITIAGASVTVEDTAAVRGSIVTGAGDLSILAPVGKGITAGVGKMYLAGSVGGDINYWSDSDLELSTDATVSGTVTRRDVPRGEEEAAQAAAGVGLGFKFMEILGLFVLGAITLRLAPKILNQTADVMSEETWSALFAGFAAMILIPAAVIFLFVTLIGIPLAFVIILVFILALIFAKLIAAYFVGSRVLVYFRSDFNQYFALILGLFLYSALILIPVFGWLAMFIIYLIAFGSLLLTKRSYYQSLRAKKLI